MKNDIECGYQKCSNVQQSTNKKAMIVHNRCNKMLTKTQKHS